MTDESTQPDATKTHQLADKIRAIGRAARETIASGIKAAENPQDSIHKRLKAAVLILQTPFSALKNSAEATQNEQSVPETLSTVGRQARNELKAAIDLFHLAAQGNSSEDQTPGNVLLRAANTPVPTGETLLRPTRADQNAPNIEHLVQASGIEDKEKKVTLTDGKSVTGAPTTPLSTPVPNSETPQPLSRKR